MYFYPKQSIFLVLLTKNKFMYIICIPLLTHTLNYSHSFERNTHLCISIRNLHTIFVQFYTHFYLTQLIVLFNMCVNRFSIIINSPN